MLHLRRTLVYTLHYEQLHNCINPIRVTESELHRCLLSNAQVPSNVSLAGRWHLNTGVANLTKPWKRLNLRLRVMKGSRRRTATPSQ